MPEKRNSGSAFIKVVSGNFVAVMIVLIALFIFIPLGKTAIDIAMVLNLALSFIVLLTVVYLKRSADFTSFPRLVLLITLFGAAINISSTRNILVHPVRSGVAHLSDQSEMVQAFADIVAGNNLVVGLIIFIIITVLQVIVITKGADRVSEVTARFTLDSMNNKMFVIQNQMNSGSITEEEAEFKIKQLRQEIDFYSAMDGSSKFVSGNVKFGIFVTVVNLIGGVVTGSLAGANLSDAFGSYTRLTIGDGLMSQVPALLLSFATGMLITGSNDDDLLTDQFKKQFTTSGTIYIIVGVALAVLGLAFHNGSSAVLIPIGLLFIFIGYRFTKTRQREEEQKVLQEEAAKNAPQKAEGGSDEISPVVKLDDLSLDITSVLFSGQLVFLNVNDLKLTCIIVCRMIYCIKVL